MSDALDPATAIRFREAGELYRAGDLAAAERLLEEVVRTAPGFARGFFLLGFIAGQANRFEAAATHLERAVALRPDDLESQRCLARALARTQRPDAAEALFRAVLERSPDDAGSWTELASLLQSAGRLEEAIEALQRATAIDPGSIIALNNLGSALRAAHRPAEAVSVLTAADALDPERKEIAVNLGAALRDIGRVEESVERLERAIRRHPGDALLRGSLGVALIKAGRNEAALGALDAAVRLDPENPGTLGRLLAERGQACDWAGVAEPAARALALVRAGKGTVHPFVLLWLDATPADQRAAANLWLARERRPVAVHVPPRRGRAGDRIRIGYLSADLHEHATAYLLAEVIELHDRRAFEVAAYSYGPSDGSAMRSRLEAAFDRFVDIAGESDAAAAARIAADSIDIVVDLKGYTDQARTGIAARRPAPLVVNYLGYPATLGEGLADYIVGDATVTPLAHAADFGERLVLLPHSYQPNDRQRPIPPAATRAECGLPDDALVLASFNSTYKCNASVFDAWCDALRAVPEAVLWVLVTHPLTAANLRRELAARGVAPERLVTAARLPLARHLARLPAADLFLDSYPCGAHTTASDALWAALPLVTRAGRTFASRVAASLLHAAGLDELVTSSADEYRRLILDLAADRSRIADLKRRLIAARGKAPLFDAPRYTANLERAYRAMWSLHVAGDPPDHIVVEETGP
jgi:predicted O-linked N-acetylglucosamine transferase (SPINDLY family)